MLIAYDHIVLSCLCLTTSRKSTIVRRGDLDEEEEQ